MYVLKALGTYFERITLACITSILICKFALILVASHLKGEGILFLSATVPVSITFLKLFTVLLLVLVVVDFLVDSVLHVLW